mgnify:CR=1 FL=1
MDGYLLLFQNSFWKACPQADKIPVDIWNLGMIYKIEVNDDGTVDLDMTFTAPNCPAADFIVEDVRTKLESVEGVKAANINLVFEPVWDQSMMSEEAKVELGFA